MTDGVEWIVWSRDGGDGRLKTEGVPGSSPKKESKGGRSTRGTIQFKLRNSKTDPIHLGVLSVVGGFSLNLTFLSVTRNVPRSPSQVRHE